jgi:hypothetical protein
MHKQMKAILVGALAMVLTVVSSDLLAQNKQPNNPVRDAASHTGEGKILWQYNTHG